MDPYILSAMAGPQSSHYVAGYAEGYRAGLEAAANVCEKRAGSGPYAESCGAHRILTSAASAIRDLSSPAPP